MTVRLDSLRQPGAGLPDRLNRREADARQDRWMLELERAMLGAKQLPPFGASPGPGPSEERAWNGDGVLAAARLEAAQPRGRASHAVREKVVDGARQRVLAAPGAPVERMEHADASGGLRVAVSRIHSGDPAPLAEPVAPTPLAPDTAMAFAPEDVRPPLVYGALARASAAGAPDATPTPMSATATSTPVPVPASTPATTPTPASVSASTPAAPIAQGVSGAAPSMEEGFQTAAMADAPAAARQAMDSVVQLPGALAGPAATQPGTTASSSTVLPQASRGGGGASLAGKAGMPEAPAAAGIVVDAASAAIVPMPARPQDIGAIGAAVARAAIVTLAGAPSASAPTGLPTVLQVGRGAAASDAAEEAPEAPEASPLAAAPEEHDAETYAKRLMHVYVADDGVHAWIRDAGLPPQHASAVARAMLAEFGASGQTLAGLTVNGKPVATRAAIPEGDADELLRAEDSGRERTAPTTTITRTGDA